MNRRANPFVSSVILLTLARGSSPAQVRPDRAAPPQPGPAPTLALPPVQTLALSNGLPVLFMESHKVPLAVVSVIVRSGAAADPLDRTGTADFTASLLREGAAGKTGLEIADTIDSLGVRLQTGASWDGATARIFAPVARLDDALRILADVLLRPDFPPEEIERERKERLTAMLQRRDEPRALAASAYQRMLFGPANRFGVDLAGTEASIRELTREDLVRYYRTYYTPSNAACIVVGDITASSLLPKLESVLGSWKGAAAPPLRLPMAAQVRERQVVLVDKPGAAQSELRVVRLGVARSTPDFYALEVLNTILGGSFTSRLNDNLRERHGYAYGASSTFLMRRTPGPFVAASAVHTPVTDKALAEVMAELARIREPVSAQELERAKSYLMLRYPAEFESTSQLAAKLGELFLYDLPANTLSQYTERIRAVTPADVERAARAYLDPERVLVVVVGDRKEIAPGLQKLKLGPIRVLTPDDVLGKPQERRDQKGED